MRVLSDGRPRANLVGLPLGLFLSGIVALAFVGGFRGRSVSSGVVDMSEPESLFEFRVTDDPTMVEVVVIATGEVIGTAQIYDASSEFSSDVWRWRFSAFGGNSGGGYLWKG